MIITSKKELKICGEFTKIELTEVLDQPGILVVSTRA
jgi:hypothetical protein